MGGRDVGGWVGVGGWADESMEEAALVGGLDVWAGF